jgi:hypothetical protein
MFTTLQTIYQMVWDHPIVFMPIFSALEVMKSEVCGEYFWNKLAFDRENDFNREKDIQDILSERFDKTVSTINFLTSIYAQIPPPASYKNLFDEVKCRSRANRVPTKILTDQYTEKSRGIAYEIKKRVSISLNVGAAQTLKAKAIKAKQSNKQQETSHHHDHHHDQHHHHHHQPSSGSSAVATSGGGGIRGMVRRISNAAANALKLRAAADTKQSKRNNYAAATTEANDDDNDDDGDDGGEGDVGIEDELYGGDPDNHHQDADKKKVKNAFYQKEKRLKKGSGAREKSEKEKEKEKDAAPPKKVSLNDYV